MSLRFENVSFAYRKDAPVVRGLSFELVPGECLLVVGANGAGKSTLLKLLNGILKPSSGRVLAFGRDTAVTPVSEIARDISVTFQNPADQIFAPTTEGEVRFGPRSLGRADADALAEHALAQLGLSHAASRHPYDLAQPERKLLTVASAIATGARLLAFDEPSVSLSEPERRVLLGALRGQRSENRALIVVSHDLGLFLPLADRLLVLSRDKPATEIQASQVSSSEAFLRSSGVRYPYPDRLERLLHQSTADGPSHTREQKP